MTIRGLIVSIIMTIVLCIMTLGYAALQQRIDIQGEATVDSTYRVEITSVAEGSATGDARSTNAPQYNGLTANFYVGLTNDTDYITYTVEITNYSTVDIILNDTEITSTNNNIKTTKSGIRNGDIMLAGSTKTVTIKIKLDTETNSEQTGTITVTFDFTRLKGGVGKVNYDYLPSNYTSVEYLQSTGTQYIDTGIYIKKDTRVEMNMSLVSTAGDQKFFGSYGGGGICLGVLGGKWRYGGSIWNGTTSENATTDVTFITVEKNLFTFNDLEYYIKYNIGSSPHTVLVFAVWYQNSVFQKASIKLYDLKLYEGGDLVQELVPALDNNDVPCMYDTVSGDTFYNSGTGTFLYQLKQ